MDTERKSLTVELKAGTEGAFTARIATLLVKDHDGDVTRAGAFPSGKSVPISSYGHGSWQGMLTVGGATLMEEGNQALAEGQFNLKTQLGRDTYETLKFNEEQGIPTEWSYGFRPVEFSFGEWEGEQVRFLEKLDVFEISPVLKGAGIETATLAIKSDQPYADHAEAVLAAVSGLLTRSRALATLRAKDGRGLSEANRERLVALQVKLCDVESEFKALLEAKGPEIDGTHLWLEFQKIQASLVGVR